MQLSDYFNQQIFTADFMETVVIIVFKIWFVASMLYVVFLASLHRFSHQWDIFRIISAYHLFTSNQPYLKLYYRDKCVDESLLLTSVSINNST